MGLQYRSCVSGSNVVAEIIWDYHSSLFLGDGLVLSVMVSRFLIFSVDV